MPDFSNLLKSPAGEAPKPKALPLGNYKGVIKNQEVVAAPPGKDYQMIVRIHVGLTEWPDNASDSEKQQETRPGEFKQIDLSKRQMRKDFYDTSLFRLDDLIKSCGIEPAGRTYEEILPQLVGSPIVVDMGFYLNKENETQNQIVSITGAR